MTAAPAPASYFERLGTHRFKPTGHASGAWRSDEQHFSPLGGLIVHAIERTRAVEHSDELLLSRISFDILGKIDLDTFDIEVTTIRPGRTIELVEATVLIAGRTVVRARAWFLARQDTSAVTGGADEPLPAPESGTPAQLSTRWPGGFIASLDARTIGTPRPGRATAWATTPVTLVAGEDASRLAAYVSLIDLANGLAVRQEPTEWMFPNLDLTIHLHRQPAGDWTGLDTTVVFGSDGTGLTSTVLHDPHGPVGRAEQTLTVRPVA